MLQAIRSKTGSLIVKALAGVLILSFAAWGIEDVIGTSASELSVATVGKQDIPPLESNTNSPEKHNVYARHLADS